MHNNNGANELITILAVNVGAYSLTGINAVMGAVSLILSVSYTAVKLYNEIKIYKKLKNKDNGTT